MTDKPSKLPPLWGDRGNSVRRVVLPLIALVALFLGVVNASGHATATRTITVEVIGKGHGQELAAAGSTAAAATRSASSRSQTTQQVTLTAKPGGGLRPTAPGRRGLRRLHRRSDAATVGPAATTSSRANFNPKRGTSQSTLTVTYADDGVAATRRSRAHVTSPQPGTRSTAGTTGGGTTLHVGRPRTARL